MSKIRVKYIRGEEVKYISHLDLIKVFKRALRRGRLPIVYSGGFNPHPQIIFGLPLPVGVTSEAGYIDFGIDGYIGPEDFVKKLNKELPDGLEITKGGILKEGNNIMKSISAASYSVLLLDAGSVEEVQEKIDYMMKETKITVKKYSKKGYKNVDIRPLIYELKLRCFGKDRRDNNGNMWLKNYVNDNIDSFLCNTDFSYENLYCLDMVVKAGSRSNLKPLLVIKALDKSGENRIEIIKIHRTGLFVNGSGELGDPLDCAVLSTI